MRAIAWAYVTRAFLSMTFVDSLKRDYLRACRKIELESCMNNCNYCRARCYAWLRPWWWWWWWYTTYPFFFKLLTCNSSLQSLTFLYTHYPSFTLLIPLLHFSTLLYTLFPSFTFLIPPLHFFSLVSTSFKWRSNQTTVQIENTDHQLFFDYAILFLIFVRNSVFYTLQSNEDFVIY